jgi:hypothetical protein
MTERPGRAERLLPWVCFAAAAILFASQLMTMFEFTPPGAEPIEEFSVIEDHGHALFVISAFAFIATIIAVWAGSKPAAIVVCGMGVFALLFFLLTDLPDAGQVGTLDSNEQSFIDAEAVPQEGFWLEMLGALALAFTGAALATMSGEQLAALRPGAKRDQDEPRISLASAPEEPAKTEAHRESG